ncbi:MAG: SRPBCC family protein [Opitutae bacterium]|nr:SRPBCC family protein [Opitutae bacterium]
MKITLIVLGVLGGLVVLAALIGLFLPREHTASRAATFAQSPAALFAAVRDVAALPTWRSGLKSAELLPARNGRASYRETGPQGPVTYVVVEERAAEKLVLRIADDSLPCGGTWTFEFSPAGTGGVLRLTERGFVKPALFRFLARFVFGHTSTMETYLRDLGRKFGQNINPQP